MTTLTIPKQLTKTGELIVISRKEYERLLRAVKKPVKQAHTQLDKDLHKSLAEYKAGKFSGPFNNTKDLIKSLKGGK